MSEHQTETHRANGPNGSQRHLSWRPEDIEGIADADRALREFVVERPFAAVGLALLAGYVVARSINAIR